MKGHSQDPWNDFVDFVAKAERDKSFYLPRPKTFDARQWRHVMPHLWMVFATDAGMPQLTQQGFDAHAPTLPSRGNQSPQISPAVVKEVEVTLMLSLATVNVLSLSAGPEGHGGKVDYIRQQFRDICLNIMGIQEARSPQSFSTAGDVVRIASGACKGHHGTELWINLRQPYAYVLGKPQFFHRRHFTVRYADPRTLLVSIDAPFLNALILVGHGPQSGQTLSDREQWWHSCGELCTKHKASANQYLFALLDANAAAGVCDDLIVGPHEDAPSASTPMLRAFLEEQDLCLPSTFLAHVGKHTTWTSPSGELQCRIDHVAIPQSLRLACEFSIVNENFDLGLTHVDHEMVGVQLHWQGLCHQSLQPRSTKKGFERADLCRSSLHADMMHYQVPGWNQDIEHHVDHFNEFVITALDKQHPSRDKGPKKPYIDDEIWALRALKLRYRKALRETQRRKKVELMFKTWSAWTQKMENQQHADSVRSYSATLACCTVRCMAQLHSVAQQLKVRLSKAKAQLLCRRLEQMPRDASAGQILQAIHKLQGPTNPKKIKRKPFPLLKKSDGTHCASSSERCDRWAEFFCNMEGGRRMTHQDLREGWIDNLQHFRQQQFDLSLESLPTLCDLERAYSHVRIGRAVGMDSIPPEACKYNVGQFARATFAQLLKMTLHGQEAIPHKGGRLTAAYKGKGDVDDCASYRSLLVSSQIGKCLHRTLRMTQSSFYETILQNQQLGGRPGIPVYLGIHHLRAFLRLQKKLNRSCCIIFLDLKEAFYRVLRPLAMQNRWDDHDIADVAKRLGLPPSIMEDLHQHLRDPCALQQAALPPILRNCITAIHTDTWFVVDGQDNDVCRTTAGSRPGDCFADTIFGYLWARVLRSLEQKCIDLGLLEAFPQQEFADPFAVHEQADPAVPQRPFLGPCWMDDLAIPIAGSSAEEAVRKVGILAGLLLDHCVNFAMSPNLAAGKTELLLALRGRKSRQLRQQFYGAHGRRLFPIVGEHGSYQIQVVTRYKHLGGIIHHGGDQRQEAKQRLAVAHQTFTQQRKVLYCNQSLDHKTRTQMFESIVCSALTYGSESWCFCTVADRHHIHVGIIKLYKRLIKWVPHKHNGWNDDEICDFLGLPTPTELLRRARLRYLGILIHCGAHAEWGLLSQDQQWISLVQDDLIWMWNQLCRSSELRDPTVHFEQWLYLMRHHRSFWKRLINRAVRHAILQRRNKLCVVKLHRRSFTLLQEAGGLVHAEPVYTKPQRDPGVFGCMQCQLRCKTKGGEGAHFFRCHGHTAPIRRLFDDTWCPCCQKEFHTLTKMQLHIRNVGICRRDLWARGHLFPLRPGIGSLESRQGDRRHDGALPQQQTQGASREPIHPRDLRVECTDLMLNLVDALADRESDDIDKILRQTIQAQPISWTQCSATLTVFLESVDVEFADMLSLDALSLRAAVEKLQRVEAWDFLDRPVIGTSGPDDELAHFDRWSSTLLQEEQPWQPSIAAPRPIGKDRIILHAFAGRRRVGDYQWYVDKMCEKSDGFLLHVVSLDIIIDKKFGDLSDPQVQAFWISGIQQGWVHGFLGGPPCATWSKARAVQPCSDQIDPRRRLPRPVRSAVHLWGLPELALRELDQVIGGNVLLGFCLESILSLAVQGMTGIVEHPAEPEGDDFPSIWKLPLVQLILTLPGAERVKLAQGLLGADSPKPTELLAVNLPSIKHDICSWRITPDLPRNSNIGRNQDGVFKTTQLKEYPPAFCAALAQCTVTAMSCFDTAEQIHVDEHFLQQCQQMVSRDFGTFIGPDHAI